MNIHKRQRFFRLAAAISIVGIVTTQVPMRPLVAQAADGYQDSNSPESNSKSLGIIAGVLLGTAALGARGGGLGAGAALASVSSSPIYDVTDSKPETFEEIAKIIRSAERVEFYRQGGRYTVFWPTNETLRRDLGEARTTSLQTPINKAQAWAFLQGITVKGNYNLAALDDAVAQHRLLKTLSGESVSLTKNGETLLANGVEVLRTESPASNGWVLTTSGVLSRDND